MASLCVKANAVGFTGAVMMSKGKDCTLWGVQVNRERLLGRLHSRNRVDFAIIVN